ncbi:MAG: hypothetical protein A3I11_08990 [Elusimicrobia bacterium RIFCSPLOWO2_02_FULL_39_32]|nr:MAG: hypothetical protein A3B80_04615 [Elusimicrobia bacterium RIFCSPHIGHO2_02_FULL_39_36]OGR93394.1 MAG: hypothetical protein A3I11_08990 [Elusimicrobia bacterium RIFCSPLOWO2_02_FULL_39_32]OGS00604.1 MAG: hypothetical protein A3G85_00165 [Elusimicrobia bacterium RIFCSPLOWO2_12_FULL_39_28]
MNFKDNKRIRFFKQSVALVVAAAFLFSTVIPPIAQAERIKSQNERYIQNLEQLSRQDSNLKQEISSVIAAVKDKILFAGPLIKGEDLFLLGAAQTNQSRHCFVIQFVRETRVEQAQAKSHAIRSFANEAQNKLRRESGIFWNGRSNMPHALVNFLAYLKIGPAYNLAKTEEDPKKLTLFLLKEGPFELSSDSNIEELKNLLGPLSEIIPETVGMSSSGKALIVFKENPTAKKVEEAAKKLASSNQFQVQAALKNALQKIYKAIGVRWEIVFQIPVLAVLMVWHSPWSLPAAMAVNIVQVIWFAKSHPYLQSKEKLAVGLVGLALGSVFFIPGLIQHLGWASVFPAMELHVVYNAAATIFGWPLASILLPESVKQKNKEVLAALGLSYTDFQKLTQEQESYDRNVISSEPMAAIHIASLRTQERFSKFVLEWTQKYREQGHGKKSLELARRAAEQHYYEDLIGKKSGPFAEMVARAFTTNDPVLFNQEPGSDKKLTATIQEIAQAAGSELSILYGNPFTEERQLIGHKVPKKGKDRLVYGLGELVRAVRKAQKELDQAKLEGRQPKKHILLLKNIEAMDAEVRVQLQEILRIGELTHTELGTVLLPENFQIMMTKRFGANIEDSSFYDRVIVKKAPAQTDFTPPAVEGIDSIKEEDYLNFVSLEVEGKKKYLALSPNIKIELDPKKFKDLTQENLHDEIYRQTGLVLDYETVRMLAAMESVVQSGQSILRIEGPTGLGKTFTAGGYAALRRSDFISNPVSEGTELSDWIGGFEQDKNNLFRFNGETTFKERLENGGVVALSELNTLLDINDNVKLAWWLQQIAEAKPDIKGYKIIRLTEVPAPEGEEVPVIKIHPRTLIVVDTNPENKYAARGSFPDIFKEYVPSLQVGEFVSGDGAKEKLEKAKIQRYLILFLRHDWRIDEVIKAKGIEDQNLRKQLSKSLSELYWRIVKGYIKEEFGKGEKALFSVRELKRMAEDIQYALQNGETNWEKAVGQAVKTHLVYRLSKPEDREIVAELLEKKFPSIWNQASQEPIGFSRLLKDQSLDKSRPVHIRVGAQTDLRPEIKTFKADHPNVILKIIPITNQTDRHMLEGGVVPNQEGDGTEFGHGVMGRLIQEAVAHPDQEIVYILENAHNLKPEEAVALNEILQDRKLYLKGRDTKLTLPQNAHIVLVSRSELTWSPAEQSRYVFMSYDQGNSYLADLFQKNVAPALIQKGVPRRISNNLNSLILNVYEKYQRILSYENANSSKLSNRRFARFIQRYVKRINRVPKGELTSDLLYDLSEEVFNEVFLLAFKKSEREDKKNFWAFKETYKSVDSWKEEKKKSRPQIATTKRILTPSPARALAQAQVDYLNANIHGIWENTVAAAQRIGQVAKDFSAAWRWSSISKQQLNITNLFKAIHLKQTLSEAGDGVNSVALSADGKQMVAGSDDHKARVYELENGNWILKQTLSDAGNGVNSVALSADGKQMVAGSWDNKVRVYELENEKWILKETLSEAGGGVNSVAMSADGSKMVAGSKDNKVRVYELENGNWILKQTLSEAGNGGVWSVALSADGSRMVAGSDDHKTRVYELENGIWILKQTLSETGGSVWSVALSADGSRMVSGSWDKKARVYQLENGNWILKQTLSEAVHAISSVALSADGSKMVAGSDDHKARLYELENENWNLKETLVDAGGGVRSVAMSADGKQMISGSLDKKARVYEPTLFMVQDESTALNLESGDPVPLRQIPDNVEKLEPLEKHELADILEELPEETRLAEILEEQPLVSPARALAQAQVDYLNANIHGIWENTVAAAQRIGQVAKDFSAAWRWSSISKQQLNITDLFKLFFVKETLSDAGNRVNSVAMSADGSRMVSGSWDKKMRVYELENGNWILKQTLSNARNRVNSVAMSADGSRMVSGSWDKKTRVYELENGNWILKQTLSNAGNVVNSVAMSADGSRIVSGSGSYDTKARVYELENGNWILKQTLVDAGSVVNSVAMSADGSRMVSGSDDNKARVYELENGNWILKQTLVDAGSSVMSVAMSADGSRMVSGSLDHKARVYELENGNWYLKQTLSDSGSVVASVAISADGNRMVSGSKDNKARVYKLENGNWYLKQTLSEVRSVVASVAISADGSRMVSGSGDMKVRVYEPTLFMVQDESTALNLETGDPVPLRQIPDNVEKLEPLEKPELAEILEEASEETRLAEILEEQPLVSPARALAQAQVDYLNANIQGIWENTVAAAQRIGQVAKSFSAAWKWSAISKQQLNITDIFKSFFVKETLSDAGNGVNSVAMSADGSRMVAGSDDHKARVYELENGNWILKETLSDAGGSVYSVAMSADGKRMVAGSYDYKARVYELENGNWILKETLSDAGSSVFSVVMSPDGSRMVAGSGDNKARVYELKNGNWILKQILSDARSVVNSVAMSADGSRMVAGSGDNKARVYQLENGNWILKQTLLDAGGLVFSVAMSADGSRMVAGSEDKKARVYELKNGNWNLKQTLSEAGNAVYSVAMSADGSRIVSGSGSNDKKVRVYQLENGNWNLKQTLSEAGNGVNSVALSANGSRMISGSGDMKVRVYEPTLFMVQDKSTALNLENGDPLPLRQIPDNVEKLELPKKPELADILEEASEETRLAEILEEPLSVSPARALAQAQVDYLNANIQGIWENTVAAAQRIGQVAKDFSAAWRWSAISKQQLNITNLFKAIHLKQILSDAGNSVRSVAMSADGLRMVSGSLDNKVRVYELENGNWILKQTLSEAGNVVSSVAMSADGLRMVSGSLDNKVRVYELENGNWILKQTLVDAVHAVRSVAMNADGSRMVLGSKDHKARVYELENGNWILKQTLSDAGNEVWSVAMNADGSRMISGSHDHKARVYNLENGNWILKQTLSDAGSVVYSVAMSADGNRMVSGSEDHKARVYNLENGNWILKQTLSDAEGGVLSVSMSADGNQMVSGSSDKKARVYELENGNWILKQTLSDAGSVVYSVAISADGNWMVSGSHDHKARVYESTLFMVQDESTALNLETGDPVPLRQIPDNVEKLEPLEKHELAEILEEQPEETNFSNIAEELPYSNRTLSPVSAARALAQAQVDYLNANIQGIWENTVAAAQKIGQVAKDFSAAWRWSSISKQQLNITELFKSFFVKQTFSDAKGSVLSVAMSADGSRMVAGSYDNKVRVYELENGMWILKQTLSEAGNMVWSVAISADGNRMVSGSYDNKARVYELKNGNWILKETLSDAEGLVRSVAMSADGSRMVAGSHDNKARVYELKNGNWILKETLSDARSVVNSVAMSADGSRMVAGSGDNKARVYELENGNWILKQTLVDAGSSVLSVAMSADGSRMVSGSLDHKARVYELENGNWILKQTLSDAGGMVNSVAMSADGSRMVSGSDDNKARVYELENGNWILKQTLSEAVHAVFSVAMSADGSRMVSGSGDNKVRVYEPTLFMVQDESTALNLETGDPVPLRNLPDNVEKLEPLEEAQQIQTTNLENILFQPRYGDKPYYFMVDRVGKVYLNFRGNLYPTRHTLMKNWIPAGVYPTGRAEMTPLNIGDIRNPYKRGNVPLDEEDLLMETEILEEVEDSILKAFEDGWHVDLEGKAGAGKTSIAMEAALLLGLPRHKFQMHGEREISDWIGGYRENSSGQIILTSKPYIKDGIKRFRHPLLDYIVNGGLFVVDEGAIGDEGRELMSWLSSIVHGDKKVYLEEFPGRVIELDVHEDFHLIITNNSPEDTQGRSILKSEIASNLHFIHVDEDESEETLKRLFIHFLGSKTPISPEDKTLLADILVKFHLELKPRIGKDLGRDDRDRHYISKREIRRIAAQIRKQVKTPDKEESQYALYKSMRIVYEAMFPSSQEREKVFKAIQKNFARTDMQTDGLSLETILLHDDEDMSNKIRQLGLIGYTIDEIMGMDSSIVLGMDVDRVLNFKKRLDAEVLERFGGSATQAEAWTAYMTEAMFNQGEPVLYISQHGARSSDMLHSAAASIHAKIIPIDAAPEHTELEILGGLFPILNKKPGKAKRSGFVRGAILSHLATESELAELKSEHQTPVVVWIRNIDQWNEEIRTALNGFLEDGYIDIEVDEGKTERFYKPPHLHFISEIASDSTGDFSSAFFNRWIKIGVGSDSLETHETEKSDFEQVLRKVYELDPLESFYLTQLYRAILEIEENKRWDNRTQYKFGAELFFMIAEGIQLAKEEMPEWQNLLERMAQTGYDPRLHPAQAPPGLEIEQKKIWKDYRGFIQEIFTQESLRLLGARLNSKTLHSEISDLERLEKILKIILKAKRLPVVNRKFHFNSEGILTKIGGIFLKSADSAKSPLAVSKHARVRYNQEAKKALEALARASQIGRAVGFAGLPGSLKTTIANHFAEITGRKFYKYQSHGGSEYTDLTIDIEQTEDGEIRKREKELYRYLKEGNVVIVIDEANISPKILWSLLPVILGEKWVHPIFPEEPPFQIGDGVQIVFTYNPSTFSGRSEIEQRILNQMILVWMNLPDQKDRAKIIEGFYGVWTGLEDEKAMAAPEEETPASEPQKKVIVREGDVSVRNRAGSDRMMRKGMETFDPNEEIKEMPFTPLDQMPKPLARGIFEPELFPHTRHKSFNRFDENSGEMFVKDDSLDAIEIPAYSQNELKAVLKEMNRTRDLFVGTYRADLSDGGWHILPSAGAGQTILELAAFDEDGNRLNVQLETAKDSAENYYVRAVPAGSVGFVEVRYRVAVPATYFGHKVSNTLSFEYAAQIPEEVKEALGLIGLNGSETNFRAVLYKIIGYFRDFSLEENGISEDKGSIYLDVVHSKCGVCRHRAHAFARTAMAIGMETNYVETDVHAYAEINVPGVGWIRVDLGGGGDPMNMNLAPLAHEMHGPRVADDFPKPQKYREVGNQFAKRMQQAMKQQGIKPQVSNRASSGRGDGGGGGGGSTDSGDQNDQDWAQSENERIQNELEKFNKKLVEDVELNDELSALFLKGRGDTEFIFRRMFKALQSKIVTMKKAMRKGLEIDPVAFMLKKPKQFVQKKKVHKIQTTAVSVLLDFSGSMSNVKEQIGFAVASIGTNSWRLREALPQHFHYDLSYFTEGASTVVKMGERMTEGEISKRLVAMANQIGGGGTNILTSMKQKLRDFQRSPEAIQAKIKYLVIFTDGADGNSISSGQLTPAFKALLQEYREAGIDVIAIGIGQGAADVEAFNEPGQHFVKIEPNRPEDIAETIAKVAEHKLFGSGILPPGDITDFLQIGPVETNLERTKAASLLDPLLLALVRVFQRAELGGLALTLNEFRKAYNIFGAMVWEEKVFREGGLVLLPLLLNALGWNPAISLMAGILWSGPIFLFLHPFLRWLVQDQIGWMGWKAEIARELRPSFDSRLFGTILFNLVYIAASYFSMGAWQSSHPNQELPIQLAMISHFLWSAWVSLPHSLEVWKGNIKSRTDSAVSVFRSLAEPFALRASLLIPTLQASMAKEKLTPEMQTNISQITASQAQMAFPLASAPIAVFRQSFSSGFNSVKNAIAKFKLNALSPSILTKNQRRALRMADEINEKKVILIHLDEFIGDEKGFNNMMLLVKSALKEIKSSVGWSRALTYAIVFNGNRKYVEKAEIELEIKANVIVNKPEDYAALKTRDENLKNASEWIIAAQSQTSLWSHLLHSRNAMIFEILDVGVNLRVNGALGARIANLKGFDANNVIEKHGDHILIKGRRLEDFNTNELIKNIRSLEQFQTSQ